MKICRLSDDEFWLLIYLSSGPVFTKIFRFRIKIRLKFQNEYFLDHFPLSVQEKIICVYIDMVNGVLGLKCIIIKYMLEAIKYNNVDPVI